MCSLFVLPLFMDSSLCVHDLFYIVGYALGGEGRHDPGGVPLSGKWKNKEKTLHTYYQYSYYLHEEYVVFRTK